MKKGFTLIELLAVIVILGVISIVVVPRINKIVNEKKNDLYERQIENILESGRVWVSKNMDKLPQEGEIVEVTLDELKRTANADMNLKNPKTNRKFDDFKTKFVIRNNNGTLKYEVIVE